MATKCKNCIHYDACKKISDVHGLAFGSSPFCDRYKDKSLVVELPCKVGDIVHRVSFVNKKVLTLKVEGFIRNLASWKAHCTHLIPTWLGNQKEHLYISFSQFGTTVFTNEEDAEAKLKEFK